MAIFAAWLTLRSCVPERQSSAPPSAPTRDQFHASKSLGVAATYMQSNGAAVAHAELSWLERELRYLLTRGKMRVAVMDPDAPASYTLRIELAQPVPTAATMKLVAPDGVVEREQEIQLDSEALATLQALANVLPSFLGAAHSTADWEEFLGTQHSKSYETFLGSANELMGTAGRGFTRPLAAESSATVDRLESLTHQQPGFARAWALLSIAYLSLGGEDEASLTRLAESTAERALALDPALTDAQSALGLVQLRRGDRATAMEHFKTALTTDPNATPALEGLGCLLLDVGHAHAALPITRRAVVLQPGNIGASECLGYAQLIAGTAAVPSEASVPLPAAQVRVLDALLSGQPETAQLALQSSTGTTGSAAWTEALLLAAANPRQVSGAMQAITRAASDGLIDPVTEIMCGAGLRQSDFVFNRMLRLHKQNESVPLRILWLPKTDFLRKHPRFEEIVSAETLLPFWQDHGLPDICSSEPAVYGCKIKPQKIRKEDRLQ